MGKVTCKAIPVKKAAGGKAGLKARQENKPLINPAMPIRKPKVGGSELTPWRPPLAALSQLSENNERFPSISQMHAVLAPPVPHYDFDMMDTSSCVEGEQVIFGSESLPAVVVGTQQPSPGIVGGAHANRSLLSDSNLLAISSPRAVLSETRFGSAGAGADSEIGRQSTPKQRLISTPAEQLSASVSGGNYCMSQRCASSPSVHSPVVLQPLFCSFDSNPGSPAAAPREVDSLSGSEMCSEEMCASKYNDSTSQVVDLTSGSEDYSVEAPRLTQMLAHAGDSVVGLNLEAARHQIDHLRQPSLIPCAPQLLQASITQYGTALKSLIDRRSFGKCPSRTGLTDELSFQMQQHLSISSAGVSSIRSGTKRSNSSKAQTSKAKKPRKRALLERSKDQPPITDWLSSFSSSMHLHLSSVNSFPTNTAAPSDTTANEDGSRAAGVSVSNESTDARVQTSSILSSSALTRSNQFLNCIVPSIPEIITPSANATGSMSHLLAALSPDHSPNQAISSGYSDAAHGHGINPADSPFDLMAGGYLLDCEKTCAPIQAGRHSLHGTACLNANTSVGRADTPEYSTPGHSPRCLAVRRLQVPFTPPARKTRHDPRYEQQSYRAKGTPYYMAPEVWRAGEHLATSDDQTSGSGREKLSTASDMWSLGCMLLEMLTMYQPFSSSLAGSEPIKKNVLAFAEPLNPDDSCTLLKLKLLTT